MSKSFTVLDNTLELNYLFKSDPIGALLSGVGYFPVLVGSVEEMVNKLIAKTKGDKIDSLLISGHGYPGGQAVGCGGGHVAGDSGKKSLKYDLNAEGSYQLMGGADKQLQRLRHKFTSDAVIMLGGCNVARGEEGKTLLSLISYETDTYVEACDESQSLIVPGWEGNVIRCYQDKHWVVKAKWF